MTSEEYKRLCRWHWYGWDKFHCTEKERQIIMSTQATSYPEFLQEHIEMAKHEMFRDHGSQYYDPSSFYDAFSKEHFYGDHIHAAHRRASNMNATFDAFISDMKFGERPLPDMKYVPSRQLVEYTWTLVNNLSNMERWAWPLLVCFHPSFYAMNWHFLRRMPFFKWVVVAFRDDNLTEDDFKDAQKEIYELVHA